MKEEKSSFMSFVEKELEMLLALEKTNITTDTKPQFEEAEEILKMSPQTYVNGLILDICKKLDGADFCDGSARLYIIDVIGKLLNSKNLTPLTLEDDEFNEVADNEEQGKIYQNRRNPYVFKTDKQGVYHLDGEEALKNERGELNE